MKLEQTSLIFRMSDKQPDFIEVLKGAMEQIKEEALKVRLVYLNPALVSKEEFERATSFPGLNSIITSGLEGNLTKQTNDLISGRFTPKSVLEDMLFVEDRGYELITMSDKTDFNNNGEPPDIVEMLKKHRNQALKEAEKYPVGSVIYQQYQIAASMVDSIIGPCLTTNKT